MADSLSLSGSSFFQKSVFVLILIVFLTGFSAAIVDENSSVSPDDNAAGATTKYVLDMEVGGPDDLNNKGLSQVNVSFSADNDFNGGVSGISGDNVTVIRDDGHTGTADYATTGTTNLTVTSTNSNQDLNIALDTTSGFDEADIEDGDAIRVNISGVKNPTNKTTYDLEATPIEQNNVIGDLVQGLSYSIDAAKPQKAVWVDQPTNTDSGENIKDSGDSGLLVEIQDQYGNKDDDYGDPVTVTIENDPSGNAILSGTVSGMTSGDVTFDDLSIDNPGSGYTLNVGNSGIDNATTSSFDISTNSITSCKTIARPSHNILSGDVTDSSGGSCVNITASNVEFDGQNNTIDGDNHGNRTALFTVGSDAKTLDNVTVKNLTIIKSGNYNGQGSGLKAGLLVEGVENSTFKALNASFSNYNFYFGDYQRDTHLNSSVIKNIESEGSDNTELAHSGYNNTIDDANISAEGASTGMSFSRGGNTTLNNSVIEASINDALYISDSGGNHIENITVDGGERGIEISSSNNRIEDSLVKNSNKEGLEIENGASSNEVFNSEFRSNSVGQIAKISASSVNITSSVFEEGGSVEFNSDNSIFNDNKVKDSGGFFTLFNDNVTIDNLTSYNNSREGVEIDGSNIELTNSNISSNGLSGVDFDSGLKNSVLENLTLNGNGRKAIFIPEEDHSDVRIENITALNSGGPTYPGAAFTNEDEQHQNITVIDMKIADGKRVSFKSGLFDLKNASSPAQEGSSLNEVGKFIEITSNSENAWAQINISYADSDVSSVPEGDIRIYDYNTSSNNYEIVDSDFQGVDKSANEVYANITEFSTFGVFDNKYEIRSCQKITGIGSYTLEENIDVNRADSCIGINETNVSLDGQYHKINGNNTEDSPGLSIQPSTFKENISVKNLNITKWRPAIESSKVENSTLKNIDIDYDSQATDSVFLDTNTENYTLKNINLTNFGWHGLDLKGQNINVIDSYIDAGGGAYDAINIGNSASGLFVNNTTVLDTSDGLSISAENATVLNSEFRGNGDNILFNDIGDAYLRNNYISGGTWDFRQELNSQNSTNVTAEKMNVSGTIVDFEARDVKFKGVAESAKPEDPSGKVNISSYINATNTSKVGSWMQINFTYTDTQAAGINESDLRVWRYNASDEWEIVSDTDVNEAENYVYANATDFSTFAAFAEPVPNVESDPASYDFGEVDVGNTDTRTFNITNVGRENLTISSLDITGDTGQFSITGDEDGTISSDKNLTRSEFWLVEVAFTPGSTGDYDADLTVQSNDPYEGTKDIPIDGEGTSSGGSPGGGGGGGAGAGDGGDGVSVSQVFFDPVQGERYSVQVDGDDRTATGVRNVSVTLSQSKTMFEITIEERNSRPEDVEQPSGSVYTYMDISSDAAEGEIGDASIAFEVNQSWIENNDINLSSIQLHRYTDSWQELDTSHVGEEGSIEVFTAVTSGFSPFAVTGTEVEDGGDDEDAPESDGGNTSEMDGGKGDGTGNDSDINQSSNQESGRSGLPVPKIIGLILVLAVAGVAVGVFVLGE